jgi:O-antigen/teichoic acid export membrane protein
MHLVAGTKFIESGKPLQILAIAVFGVYLGSVFGHTAIAINRQKEILWIFISNAIITTIGYLIFIPKFGLYGAAWMTVFSELYTGILLFLVIRHYSQINIEIKTSLKIILAGLIMGGILAFLINLHVIILVLIGALSYGLLLLVFKVISKNTLQEVFLIKKQS